MVEYVHAQQWLTEVPRSCLLEWLAQGPTYWISATVVTRGWQLGRGESQFLLRE